MLCKKCGKCVEIYTCNVQTESVAENIAPIAAFS
jgi:hypothetical protein